MGVGGEGKSSPGSETTEKSSAASGDGSSWEGRSSGAQRHS